MKLPVSLAKTAMPYEFRLRNRDYYRCCTVKGEGLDEIKVFSQALLPDAAAWFDLDFHF